MQAASSRAHVAELLCSRVPRAADAPLACAQDYTWRNVLQFSPTEKKEGYSYADVVLAPMARAVNRVMR